MTKFQRLLHNKDNNELAERLLVSVRTIQRWKRGDCVPYHPNMFKAVLSRLTKWGK